MKTFVVKKKDLKNNWYIINAENKILGRLATELAKRLIGKHKIKYTTHLDNGDYIIVLNAKKIIISGNKKNNKIYYRHTGYIGGIKKKTFKEMILHYPEKIIKNAVKGMLPKGPLGRIMFKKLKVFPDNNHNHYAQKPKIINI
ncbi:50S ribosomal protein L13 [Enterobacteriaceae bacterium ET-AT1-13]|uniref:Large ribosomal subunit protein uL13c n=1 Tax=Cacopsylla melanoneura TaxID=428564 RepID=A0A8D8UJG7_9HEMI|nr:50S ribosomal protein L13 [Enterobacteriaceae bacterium ET-AT1-13]WGS66472.1 50S ribosomal protein L13 [Enterobacteriaceae bacterium Cmel17]WMC17497.1 MAG: 50S ribosomal protein L13 [Enterobacteriaceae bacterium Cmel21]WMC17704.1 MAG: 50S ribosomal protein L13 [Enterobacteriaceae bacterium PSmelAO3-2]WMC17908.1 MAG: 50S ribosomal protein L13 [Enterobacteriaceae bacterium PSmelAO3-1]WMC18111.1 MAG: 50S ribosomal protein L13 [Enterobacteriaceae bacterium PSmelAO1]